MSWLRGLGSKKTPELREDAPVTAIPFEDIGIDGEDISAHLEAERASARYIPVPQATADPDLQYGEGGRATVTPLPDLESKRPHINPRRK